MSVKKTCITVLLCVLALGLLATGDVQSQTDDDEFKAITAKVLKMLLDSGKDPFLLNPLCDLVYDSGHILGSTNVPLATIATSDLMPEDKDRMIICYCLGVT